MPETRNEEERACATTRAGKNTRATVRNEGGGEPPESLEMKRRFKDLRPAEVLALAWIRNRCRDTPFLQAAFQVVVGGVLVFVSGILIGSA